jgi:hypothetical protein
MLLSFLGVDVSQESIVEKAGVGERIEGYGMLVSEMAQAVGALFPQFQFWYKEGLSISDLETLVEAYKYPVAVEWQGVFYEDSDEDDGHYSVVTHVDSANSIIVLADPYKRFAGTDRSFHITEFENRWWDENEIKDPITGQINVVRDTHLAFVITDKNISFPESLGMVRG